LSSIGVVCVTLRGVFELAVVGYTPRACAKCGRAGGSDGFQSEVVCGRNRPA